MTRVVKVRRRGLPPYSASGIATPNYTVYIGRAWAGLPASKWGNPFRGPGACNKYRIWIRHQPHLMAAIPELVDQTLGCWCHDCDGMCSPATCHGDVLCELVREYLSTRVA
jgi:hypothetical protein